MAKQRITGLSASLLEQSSPAVSSAQPQSADTPAAGQKPIVQTVKVPPEDYIRLKTVGAKERRSAQDIILAALREYLNKRT
jgi:hypothetical protein